MKGSKMVWMKNSLKFDMYFRMLCFETFAFFSKKKPFLVHECMRCILLLSLMFIYNSSWKELVKMALASKTFVFNKDLTFPGGRVTFRNLTYYPTNKTPSKIKRTKNHQQPINQQ